MTDLGLPKTDEELVQATLAGCRESFVWLIRRYEHLVFGLCRNMLGRREDALASQDTFIAAYQRLGELRRQADFRPWLRQIGANECRQRLRSRKKAETIDENTAWVDPFGKANEAIDLNRAIANLGEENRLAVLLFYFEGNSLRDIALFLGIPETTVMSRLRNARSQLRRDLQSMFDQPQIHSSLPKDFADRIPIPYDEYGPIAIDTTYEPLSDWRRNWLLAAFPTGSTIESVQVEGYDWEQIQDRAVRVVVRQSTKETTDVHLRMSGRKEGVRIDAALLPILAEQGLNVPKVVAGPTEDPAFPDRGLLVATTPPPGQSALAWAVDGGIKATDHACDVILEAIDQIASVTADIENSPAKNLLERCSLNDELKRIKEIGGPWMTDLRFADAIKQLEPMVAKIDVPLIFSDSGIGPNVRVDDQGNLLGYESFAWARIEDPHYQITKYWTYDCWPVRRAGFVERYLVSKGLSMRDFAPRLAIRALVTLQREIPLQAGDGTYRNDMLAWLSLAMQNLK